MSTTTKGTEPPETLLGLDEARQRLGGVSRKTLYRLADDGQLRIVKLRRRSLIRRSDIEALIDRATRRTAP